VSGHSAAEDQRRKEGARGANAFAPGSDQSLKALPINDVLPQLFATLAAHANAVVVAPPGAGKTTRVPPALLGLGPGAVVVLEPRRVAARAAARRIAEERGWRLGSEVGYQVRFDRVAGAATRLLIVTEGILVQRLQADPFLDGVAAVVFDELHERSLDADLALAMARRVQAEVRPDLRLVAMSATLDPGPVAAFLGGCPVVESTGRLHPVEVVHLERQDSRPLPRQVAAAVERALVATDGDVLAFLPGVGEIRRTRDALRDAGIGAVIPADGRRRERSAAPLATAAAARAAQGAVAVLPLYGDLPGEQQDAALRAGPDRRVVLATNVAETSVTVEGVTAVVDSGLARVLRYDPASGLDRLELVRVSRASADQRAGRAGRLAPGVCFRLWTEHDERGLRPRETPEIARVDLARPALQLLAWGERDLAAFRWLEPPDPAALARARELLALLGAVDAAGITARGRAMARLPVHPRLARLLVEGRRLGRPREAALLAALLAERPPWRRVPREGREGNRGAAVVASRSDVVDRLEALGAVAHVLRAGRSGRLSGGLDQAENARDVARALRKPDRVDETTWGRFDPGAARAVFEVRDRLLELIERSGGEPEAVRRLGGEGKAPPAAVPADLDEVLGRALLAAYPDRVARRRDPNSPRGVMAGGRGVRLAAESAVTEAELFVCVDLDAGPGGAGSEALVRLASAVEPEWLPAEWLGEATEVEFDPARERVVARRRTRYRDLVLAEREVSPDPGAAAEVLAAAAAQALDRALPLGESEVSQWLARLRSLAAWMPDLGLPELRDDALRDLLPALCHGRRSFEELRQAPLLDALRGTLTHAQLATLEREAPERLAVPSGSRIRLHYEEGKPPVLAARIQELFGWAETPRVAAGRVPVLLHLLAPNGRPQQVTRDLKSFWQTTYPQVRKELAGRYPKHAWPSDPWTAPPERRPRRR
jgi:ATP-dependent helicase HrpB